ncbi:MAG: HYExAFE family protein, partial [Planctomycetota bacterium]
MRLREHYERAFAWYLRENRVPYISVDEARRALLPDDASLSVAVGGEEAPRTLKNFDFVAYTAHGNYLVDIKGRKVTGKGTGEGRLESWVTQGDVDSLTVWESLFRSPHARLDDPTNGPTGDSAGFSGAFVFLYWLASPPPDGLFQEIFEFEGRWYAVRSVELATYISRMKV